MHWEKSVGVSYRKEKGRKGREEVEYWPESWVSKLSDLHLPHKCSCRLTGRRGANTAHTHRHTQTHIYTVMYAFATAKSARERGSSTTYFPTRLYQFMRAPYLPFLILLFFLCFFSNWLCLVCSQGSRRVLCCQFSVLCSLFDICIIFLHHLNISNFCSQFLWRRVVNHVHRQLSARSSRASDDDVIRIAYKNDTMSVHTHTHTRISIDLCMCICYRIYRFMFIFLSLSLAASLPPSLCVVYVFIAPLICRRQNV